MWNIKKCLKFDSGYTHIKSVNYVLWTAQLIDLLALWKASLN